MESILLMEKYDYNILIALFDLFSRVKLFMREDRNEIFNIVLPNKKELLNRINKLIDLGLIYCKDRDNSVIQKKIITELDINISLCLTIEGGELLEKKLNISWDEYIYEEVGYYAEDIYEVTIQSNSLDKIHKVSSFLPPEHKKPNIETLSPWFPAYWKKLPIGYKISIPISEEYYVANLQDNQNYLHFVHPFYSGFPKLYLG